MHVALLGATGLIGKAYQTCLTSHPWFVGVPVRSVDEAANFPLIFSILPSSAALESERELIRRGCRIISSAPVHRMVPEVPLCIPEVNPEALSTLPKQGGWIVAKPNCTVHTFVLALHPLHRRFGITSLSITSLQALSGGGKQALQNPRLLQGVSCWIPDEEEKCREEPPKIWNLPSLQVSAQCNRVPTYSGHVVSISVQFQSTPHPEEILESWASFSPLTLPSSPYPLIQYHPNDLPILEDSGMGVHCARLQQDCYGHFRFIAAAHNLIRGGAGAGCLLAEYLWTQGVFHA